MRANRCRAPSRVRDLLPFAVETGGTLALLRLQRGQGVFELVERLFLPLRLIGQPDQPAAQIVQFGLKGLGLALQLLLALFAGLKLLLDPLQRVLGCVGLGAALRIRRLDEDQSGDDDEACKQSLSRPGYPFPDKYPLPPGERAG